ncbi:MAG: phosphotransferase [Firmicutes bacterium]|nr:phosphotransferase [Bacillota bacterium]
MANHSEAAGLLTRIYEVYGIPAFGIKPHGTVWKLAAPDGNYGLKHLKLSTEQIHDLAGIFANLTKAGFPHLSRPLTTKSGAVWFTAAGRNYILAPWYDGENPDFRNPEHLTQVARLFGRLHSFSAQLGPVPNSIRRNGLLKYQERTDFLGRVLEGLRQAPPPDLRFSQWRIQRINRIDRNILKSGPHFLAQAQFMAQELKANGAGYQLNDLLPVGFCHNDPAPRNLILRRGEIVMIDFEHSGWDHFICEVTTLLNRSLEANQWNGDIFELIVGAYEMERSLTPAESRLLPYLLLFPQRFWRICRQRYHEDLQWTEKRFARRLHQIMDQEPYRAKFLGKWFPQEIVCCPDNAKTNCWPDMRLP